MSFKLRHQSSFAGMAQSAPVPLPTVVLGAKVTFLGCSKASTFTSLTSSPCVQTPR